MKDKNFHQYVEKVTCQVNVRSNHDRDTVPTTQ